MEVRRLLVAEGAVFSVNETLDGSGLPGDLSAAVVWGDGSTSSATVVKTDANSKLSFEFDYSLDTGGFFSGANTWRRSLLEFAGEAILQRFTDTLAAITPSKTNTWQPTVWHPSEGPVAQSVLHNLPTSLRVPSNTIIVYVGSRDLPGDVRGLGGPGGVLQFRGSQGFLDTVLGRGEPGALAETPTDFAPSIGSLSFDSESSTNWYFGRDPHGMGAGQVDFVSVAIHELFHVLGFGTAPSWQNLASATAFGGKNAKASDNQPNGVPLHGAHFSSQVRSADGSIPLMAEQLQAGIRRLPTQLDFAALDDIGWQLADTSLKVTATHRFADNGTYPVEVVVQGFDSQRLVAERRISVEDVRVTNAKPSLSVPADWTVQAGQTFSITDIGVVTDPGFRNQSADPSTVESFTFSIDWGDGKSPDTGKATIDKHGNTNGTLTQASFNGTHQYSQSGRKVVEVQVKDDDGGSRTKTFHIDVTPAPEIVLELSQSSVAENDGTNAAQLTISKVNFQDDSAVRVDLDSSDPTEIKLPAFTVIPADEQSITVRVDAIDDALLDGDMDVTLTASAAGIDSRTIDLLVADHEHLQVEFSESVVTEGDEAGIDVTVRRSNTNLGQPVEVQISGGSSAQVIRPATITIPKNQQQITVKFIPKDDAQPEAAVKLNYLFGADGYVDARVEIEVLDDEPPAFQNPDDPYDVNGADGVKASDALRVINELARRVDINLDPRTESANGTYLDVNGDYRVTALDALIVINELKNRSENGEPLVDRPRPATSRDDDDHRDVVGDSNDGLLF